MNLVRGSVSFGWFGKFKVLFSRMNIGLGGSRFRIFRVVPISNWKNPFFDILCSKNLWFDLRFSLFWEVRRFEVQFQRITALQTVWKAGNS